jgi:acyl-CoA thioester hydrolase
MKFTNKQYVRWDDLDALRHVNNAKYLTYAQEARFAWSGMLEMVVARAELDFKLPIYDGNIFVDVTLWVESIGTSSFTMIYEITYEGELLARIKTVQVTISPETKKSRPINETEREFLSKYLETE